MLTDLAAWQEKAGRLQREARVLEGKPKEMTDADLELFLGRAMGMLSWEALKGSEKVQVIIWPLPEVEG